MKKRTKKILIAVLSLLIILSAVAFAVGRPDIRYVISSKVRMIGEGEKPTESEPVAPMRSYTKAQLEAMPNVNFDESMRLINDEHTVENETFDVREYKSSGVFMNACALSSYSELSAAVGENTGASLYVSSAYRSFEEQQEIYENDTKAVAVKPGASEHEAGLGVDLYVKMFAGYGFLKSDAGQFVDSNAYKYGFIIRYPLGKKSKTGVKYEPWHIRYVGEPHAEIIHKNGMCLEEYAQLFEEDKFYTYNEYTITVQCGESFTLPGQFDEAVVSKIYGDRYMITLK